MVNWASFNDSHTTYLLQKSRSLPRDRNLYGSYTLPPEMPLPLVPDNMYSSRPLPLEVALPPVPDSTYGSRPLPPEIPLPPVPDNTYGSRPLPPEMPLPPVPNESPKISSSASRPPPPEIPLPPVPTEELYKTRSLPRSSSPLLRHQRCPSPFSDEAPSIPPRQSLSPPQVDDIGNRPPAPLPHAPRASRPPAVSGMVW